MKATDCRWSRSVLARGVMLWALAALGLLVVVPSVWADSLDRKVAEWVLLLGGSVRLDGQQDRTREISELPREDFRIELVDLVGANILPPDLQWLIGLKGLKTLNLPGPMWNPSAGASVDYSRDLRHLAGIKTLEELTFSYTYLAEIKFQDDGIEELAPLAASLKVLSLENTQVRGHRLAPFTNLEALDLVYCPVDDQGLAQIQGLTKLRRLLLRDAVISDQGLGYLSELRAIEQLDLGGTKITDEGIRLLRNDKTEKVESAGDRSYGCCDVLPGGNGRSGRAELVWH